MSTVTVIIWGNKPLIHNHTITLDVEACMCKLCQKRDQKVLECTKKLQYIADSIYVIPWKDQQNIEVKLIVCAIVLPTKIGCNLWVFFYKCWGLNLRAHTFSSSFTSAQSTIILCNWIFWCSHQQRRETKWSITRRRIPVRALGCLWRCFYIRDGSSH